MRIIFPDQRPSMPPARGDYPVVQGHLGRLAVRVATAGPIPAAEGTSVSIAGTFAGKGFSGAPAILAAGDVRGVPPRGKPV